MVHSPIVPGLDFWLDWSVDATVERLRRLLPVLVAPAGYRAREIESMMTHAGWAQVALEAPELAQPFGIVRAQDAGEGRAQLIVAPGPGRSPAELAALNRAGLALYCGLLSRGLLDPPAPLERPAQALVPPEA